ncbi:4'-phosphopantetheinyl transferase family protein [Dyella sp.]|uniref:4'-phosphopantetheinyl transferase family protein n=1 Tax=Dyella sp. TaxID=1869338 RepID=UPI002ED1E631
MQTTDGQTVSKLAEQLGPDELHVWRMPHARHRGREPLLAMLAVYLGCEEGMVRLVESEHGRPELETGHRLRFNWSHSMDTALLAVALDVQPGVDVERLRPRPRALEIARRYFCADETAWLERLAPDAVAHGFLQLWTAKEAVLKALGRGLAFGLDRLRIGMSHGEPGLQWLDGDDASAWQLRRLTSDGDIAASVAWRGPGLSVRNLTLAAGD